MKEKAPRMAFEVHSGRLALICFDPRDAKRVSLSIPEKPSVRFVNEKWSWQAEKRIPR